MGAQGLGLLGLRLRAYAVKGPGFAPGEGGGSGGELGRPRV